LGTFDHGTLLMPVMHGTKYMLQLNVTANDIIVYRKVDVINSRW